MKDLALLFQAHGLGRLVPHLPTLARPSIRLLENEQSPNAVGCCRLGGLPDAPDGFVWPRVGDCLPSPQLADVDLEAPLAFLGQLNWKQLKPFDLETVLPLSGGALFFVAFGAWAYHVVPVPEFSSRQALAPKNLQDVLPARILAPRIEWTLPYYGSHGTIGGGDYRNCFFDVLAPEAEFLELDEAEQGAYEEVRLQLQAPSSRYVPHHRVLGHPDYEQNPMRLELEEQARGLSLDYETYLTLCDPQAPLTEQLKQQALESDWQLAFQVACFCDHPDLWGDGGTYYFWSQTQELLLPNPRFVGDGQCG